MLDSIWNTVAFWTPPIPADNVWFFLALGSLSAVVFGMGKVGFGGGIGILSVPIMIYACGGNTALATGLMLPLLISADYVGVGSWRRQWDWGGVKKLIPGACVGILIGAGLLWWFQQLGASDVTNAAMKLGVGAIALGFVVLRGVQGVTHKQWTFQPVLWQAIIAGILLGFTSTLAHAAGPVATMYLLSQRMPKNRFVATTVLLFWIVNQLKVIPYVALGMIHSQSLLAGLWLVPAVIFGAVSGKWLNGRVSQTHFSVIVYSLLAATGIHMILQACLSL